MNYWPWIGKWVGVWAISAGAMFAGDRNRDLLAAEAAALAFVILSAATLLVGGIRHLLSRRQRGQVPEK